MFVFLPPSEGKAAPCSGRSDKLNLDSLVLPQLRQPRQQVIQALMEASARNDAQDLLRVGAGVMAEVEANIHLCTAEVAPAHQIYAGVLFEALQAQTLSVGQLQRADEKVMIFSALFGVTGFSDLLPAHRLAMGVTLSPFGDERDVGRLGTFWRRALTDQLSGLIGDELVLDCRSTAYAAAFRPPAQQTLMVNSYTEAAGRRTVVTHFAKQARGTLVGMLLRQPQLPTSIDEIADIAAQHWSVEVRPAEGSAAHQLDLISAAE